MIAEEKGGGVEEVAIVEEEDQEGLFKADAVNEDPERDRATQGGAGAGAGFIQS